MPLLPIYFQIMLGFKSIFAKMKPVQETLSFASVWKSFSKARLINLKNSDKILKEFGIGMCLRKMAFSPFLVRFFIMPIYDFGGSKDMGNPLAINDLLPKTKFILVRNKKRCLHVCLVKRKYDSSFSRK